MCARLLALFRHSGFPAASDQEGPLRSARSTSLQGREVELHARPSFSLSDSVASSFPWQSCPSIALSYGDNSQEISDLAHASR